MGKKYKKCRSICPTALSLEIIGDTWSLILVREFIFMGKREYGEFIELMEGISSNVLIDRLKLLTHEGIFTKHNHPTNKKKNYYDLTDKGFDLIIVIMELARWGVNYLPDAYLPPEIIEFYINDSQEFKKYWKGEIDSRTQDYVKKANDSK